jgi:proline iminopeptidase
MPAEVFPAIEPYASGLLDVGEGHRVYWETCGSPAGKAALVVHGGPGSGCTPGMRRMFDPAVFRIVLFDQRNAGRSLPHASDPAVDLSTNTTPRPLADIERLREHLGVERWVVFGGSWGTTLALAYAEAHPQRVAALVLSHVGLTRPKDVHWLYHGVGRYFPDAWARFRNGAGVSGPDANLVVAYRELLKAPDRAVREKAARDWCDWEAAVISTDPSLPRPPRYADPAFRMAFARIVTHYFSHAAWLDADALVAGAYRLATIPGVLICGGQDLGAPLDGPRDLHAAWPASELIVIEAAGHETQTPGVMDATLDAIARFSAL